MVSTTLSTQADISAPYPRAFCAEAPTLPDVSLPVCGQGEYS